MASKDQQIKDLDRKLVSLQATLKASHNGLIDIHMMIDAPAAATMVGIEPMVCSSP